ncbi:DegT/DnrJ/EryC1/StrS family aminotransferase [Paracoccaceae bacterium]|jgi:dTDP-4-amino-4,6-dideoxygalactose transaminase|nr:DegT/DnrJ/EryC1/StrS family aminotransferase [Paracoccaceae bacterium]
MSKKIFVTKPTLPPLEEFQPYLQKIWKSSILTNGGPFHSQLEIELAEYLGVPYVSLFNNGTIALVTALNSLVPSGEVITTPFSFVATSHAILWNKLTPVFVDIEPDTLNLDPYQVEAAINSKTTAILPVHCYGNPTRVEIFEDIAKRHKLKLIYDASHAFGVKKNHNSILNFGDLSTLSFHATKVFNTFEGGAVICQNKKIKNQIDKLKNFGIENETNVEITGINGKMSEINSAFGLLQLKYIDEAIRKRKKISETYVDALNSIENLDPVTFSRTVTNKNYSYFPVLVKPNYPSSRDELFWKLKSNGVHPRRYFYPLINEFQMYKNLPSSDSSLMPVAKKIADEILCLPIYPELASSDIDFIIHLLKPS